MFGSSISSRIKSLDVYKNLPRDLTEPTMSGALISLISSAIIVILLVSEITAYLSMHIVSEMQVDNGLENNKLKVNIDVSFSAIPCQLLSVDVQDIMGNHEVNVGGSLLRRSFDKDGLTLKHDIQVPNHDSHDHHTKEHSLDINFESLVNSFKNKEGCQLYGTIIINKVPGNFHISAHAFGSILGNLFATLGIQNLDISHKINHISFGDESDIKNIKKKFSVGVLDPLDGFHFQLSDQDKSRGMMQQYYLNVVPSLYIDVNGNEYNAHQFTVNSNTVNIASLSAVYFRYDLSPIVVNFTQKQEPFLHFIVQLCAILGGVFTVAGIIDGIFHKSIMTLLKKAEMGKLH